jgi:hypothetical protein
MKEFEMAEAKGLSKPVKLKKDLAELLEATELPKRSGRVTGSNRTSQDRDHQKIMGLY